MADKPRFQVTCHTPDNADPDRRLQGLGGPKLGGWWDNIDTLIRDIEAGKYDLWTTTPHGEAVWVYVRQTDAGRKFLTTQADGREPNNLLALPYCQ